MSALLTPDECFVRCGHDHSTDSRPLLPVPIFGVHKRSPSESWIDLLEAVLEDLKAGAASIVLDPKTSTASVFRPNDLQDIFAADQTLTIPDVLPGFAVAVGTLFG